MRQIKLSIVFILTLVLSQFASAESTAPTTYETLGWEALIPQSDLDTLLNPPNYIDNIEDGSMNDNFAALMDQSTQSEEAKKYQSALQSTNIIKEMKDKFIRLPGFIVPLAQNEDQLVTEFFIVPYFGACLHFPPPPPNQIIHVEFEDGIELEDISQPFWFEGKLDLRLLESELGTSAYSMALDNLNLYEG